MLLGITLASLENGYKFANFIILLILKELTIAVKFDKCPCSKVYLIIAKLCSAHIARQLIYLILSFHACKSIPKIRDYHWTIRAVIKQECAVTKCKLCSIICKVTGKSCHNKHNTLTAQHLGNKYKSKKTRNLFCSYVYVLKMTSHICDRICEKGSYTCIQFFNFKEM